MTVDCSGCSQAQFNADLKRGTLIAWPGKVAIDDGEQSAYAFGFKYDSERYTVEPDLRMVSASLCDTTYTQCLPLIVLERSTS